MKGIKTNAMRLLEKSGVAYHTLTYDLGGEPFSGEAVCRALGLDPAGGFKTLCARGERRGVAVYVIPIAGELDLKAAARALGDKAVELTAVKDLVALTGYERGAVSPVGMKKRYPVFIDESARARGTIEISGGMKGVSLMLEARALAAFLDAEFYPLVKASVQGTTRGP